MKRLIKAENINVYDKVDISPISENTDDMEDMIQLDELSQADVRHERCPNCKYNPLKRDNGFKICPRCDTLYKVFDGEAYIVKPRDERKRES